MPEEIAPISIRNIGSSGVILEDIVDESLMPVGAVNWAINMHFDRIGASAVRTGYTILGANVGGSTILGLHQFLDTGTGTNDRLIAVQGTVAYALITGTWTSKRTGLTAASKARFTNFVDLVFMVNGVDAMQSWDGGAGNFSTTHVTSAPAASYIENFRTRVWAAKTSANPSRVYYSSVANASGAIFWTGSVGEGYIDVAPGDGEDVSGIKKFDGTLWVAKPSNMYRIFSINESEPDARVFVGTYSQESMVTTKEGLYWHHSSGIYRVRKGESTPTEISRPIYTFIKNITRANYTEVAAWSDDDHVYFSVGDVTVNGVTVTNCTLRWTISSEVWTVYSHANRFVCGNSYDISSGIYRVVGDSLGNVHTYDSGYTDNGTPIMYELETRWYNLSGLRSEIKTIRELTSLSEKMQGSKLGWRGGKNSFNSVQPIGQIDSDEHTFKSQNITGNRIKFSISGSSTGVSGIFQGFEINNWLNEGVTA